MKLCRIFFIKIIYNDDAWSACIEEVRDQDTMSNYLKKLPSNTKPCTDCMHRMASSSFENVIYLQNRGASNLRTDTTIFLLHISQIRLFCNTKYCCYIGYVHLSTHSHTHTLTHTHTHILLWLKQNRNHKDVVSSVLRFKGVKIFRLSPFYSF